MAEFLLSWNKHFQGKLTADDFEGAQRLARAFLNANTSVTITGLEPLQTVVPVEPKGPSPLPAHAGDENVKPAS